MMTFVLTLAPAKMLYLNPIVTNGKPLATVESHCFYQRAYRPYRLFGLDNYTVESFGHSTERYKVPPCDRPTHMSIHLRKSRKTGNPMRKFYKGAIP